MPQPLRELRVKNAYVNHKAIVASQGVKITAKDLEKTLAGTPIFVAKKPDEIEVLKVRCLLPPSLPPTLPPFSLLTGRGIEGS